MNTNKKILPFILISIYLLSFVSVLCMRAAYTATDAANLESIEVDQPVGKSSEKNLSGTFKGGGEYQTLQFSSAPDYVYVAQHLMCKDHYHYSPIEPTTIFRPSDVKAVCLTIVSIKAYETVDFKWYYRNDSSKAWISCWNWSYADPFNLDGEHAIAGYLNISGCWPGLNYPKAYKVEVYHMNSSLLFTDYFEVTNGGLNSPRMCENVDVNGNPVNVKSRFTIGVDVKAYHYLRFDKIAYYNEELGYCHNFTTLWIQPDGSIYKRHSSNFLDYKNVNITWNYWKYGYVSDDYININSSTPSGNWKVEVYLDNYISNRTLTSYGPIATTHFIVGSGSVADWTFMVYLDADNTLENASLDIFQNIASVGSTSKVNIVVQMDRSPSPDTGPGNWTECYRFKVTQGMIPLPENAILNLTEVNMGDPDTLKDFVNWTIENYPANYYSLVLFDHGAGWAGLCFDMTSRNDNLTLPELSQALAGLPAIMDVVFTDACSMSMIEVAYQIKDYSNVLVGPEGLGYAEVNDSPVPYDTYLSDLIGNSSISPSTFAEKIVTNYVNWCNTVPVPNATMVATDLTKIADLITATEDFAIDLKEKETPYHEQISLARSQAQRYEGPFQGDNDYLLDLYHFAQLIHQNVPDGKLQDTAYQLMLSIDSTIIIEDDKADPNSHGLSILLPGQKQKYDSYRNSYEKTTFAINILWDDFIKYHLSGYVLTIELSYPDIPVSINETSYTTDANGIVPVFVLPGYYTVNLTTPFLISSCSRRVFDKWNDNSTENPRTFFVDNEQRLRAIYETQHRLNMDENFGTTNPSAGEHWKKAGETLLISASAPTSVSGEQYVWVGWVGDGVGSYSGTMNPVSITMEGPMNETATWRILSWWEILFRPEMVQIVLGFLGVMLTVSFVGVAWVRSRRTRSIVRTFLGEIDDIYSRLKNEPLKCEEELSRLRNTVLKGLTDGKINEECYNIIDKKIDKYMEELRKQKET